MNLFDIYCDVQLLSFVFQDVTAKLIPIVVIQILMMQLHSLQIIRNARHADVSQWVLDFVY